MMPRSRPVYSVRKLLYELMESYPDDEDKKAILRFLKWLEDKGKL